jgi:Phage integrase, N-terminal SAM-like domain
LERSTIDAYAQHTKLHIEPFLGRMKLSQISAPSVREFEDKLRSGKPAPGVYSKRISPLELQVILAARALITLQELAGLPNRASQAPE